MSGVDNPAVLVTGRDLELGVSMKYELKNMHRAALPN